MTKDDRMIPPDAQRMMAKRAGATCGRRAATPSTCLEPEVVAEFIAKAAKSVSSKTTA